MKAWFGMWSDATTLLKLHRFATLPDVERGAHDFRDLDRDGILHHIQHLNKITVLNYTQT